MTVYNCLEEPLSKLRYEYHVTYLRQLVSISCLLLFKLFLNGNWIICNKCVIAAIISGVFRNHSRRDFF